MTTTVLASTQALRERILDAGERRSALRIVGAGSWLDAGRPVLAVEQLSIRELSGIVEYVPGDLTLTAKAGTTLAEIRDATFPHGQWLALDPAGGDEGTLGATVATASAGPLSSSFGTPRDLTLGIEFVLGTGVVARGGGRVVKNVAGFDLTRLLTGSWGTLGVITEVTVRLHARPEVDESYAAPIAAGSVGRVRQLLRRLPFTPYACEILNASFAHKLLDIDQEAALVRLGGNVEAVAAQRAALAELGELRAVGAEVWQGLRASDGGHAIVLRISGLPSEIENTWSSAARELGSGAGVLMHASPARGVVRCIAPATADTVAAARRTFTARAATATTSAVTPPTLIAERLPRELWPLVASPTDDALSRRIKQTFDPAGVLNPGIFGERWAESA